MTALPRIQHARNVAPHFGEVHATPEPGCPECGLPPEPPRVITAVVLLTSGTRLSETFPTPEAASAWARATWRLWADEDAAESAWVLVPGQRAMRVGSFGLVADELPQAEQPTGGACDCGKAACHLCGGLL